MASPVSPLWRVPRIPETHMGRPVLGRTLVAMAGALNHLNALQARGFAPVSIMQGPALAVADVDDVGYFHAEPARYESIWAPYYVPEGVDLLHVALVCLSWERDGTQAPEVTVDVVESGLVAMVDEGCTWTRATGALPGDEFSVAGDDYLRPYLIESSTRFQAADPTSGPTDPRRLSVGSKAGSMVVIRVATIRCQVVALFVLPVPPESIG